MFEGGSLIFRKEDLQFGLLSSQVSALLNRKKLRQYSGKSEERRHHEFES